MTGLTTRPTCSAYSTSGLDVHTYDGVAWVGLTPFLLCDFRPPGFPAIPGLSTFPETNVRTYVVDRNGLIHERIKRQPVLGGLINEYERAA
ncbi:MAG TPA: DUF2071 domain-containing protein [Pseudonocardiaceae bacterium]|nr:DUF2071 domain-containing protein [Pseudonocardiaceae bacterium]